jgi:hypothetical protein
MRLKAYSHERRPSTCPFRLGTVASSRDSRAQVVLTAKGVAGFLAGARLSVRPSEALSYWNHVVTPGRWGQDPFLRER